MVDQQPNSACDGPGESLADPAPRNHALESGRKRTLRRTDVDGFEGTWRNPRIMRSCARALALVLCLAPHAARAENIGIASGVYTDAMLVGFNPATRLVSGYFNSSAGRGHFRCVFYLAGRLQEPTASISTYFPETSAADLIRGEFLIEGRQHFQVRLPSEHGGCWNVTRFADKAQPAAFTLQASYAWTSVAVVKRDRAYFFDSPASSTHRKGYVLKGDGVGVRATRRGWLQVDFVGRERDQAVSGWIRLDQAIGRLSR